MKSRGLVSLILVVIVLFISGTGPAWSFVGTDTILGSNLSEGVSINATDIGGFNVFIGGIAGFASTTGVCNSFIGLGAGYSNDIGSYNTALGKAAGYSNTAGNGNVFLGAGAGSTETGSNKLYYR